MKTPLDTCMCDKRTNTRRSCPINPSCKFVLLPAFKTRMGGASSLHLVRYTCMCLVASARYTVDLLVSAGGTRNNVVSSEILDQVNRVFLFM